MAKVVAIHSYRGGTGKSNTTANLAAAIASAGHRVAVIDTDIQSPGIHVLFGLEPDVTKHTLNNYLWGDCTIVDAAHEVTPSGFKESQGKIFLVPSSSELADITRVLQEGYDVKLLRDGFRTLVKELNLDYILIDTHPGLNEETLLAIAVSNILLVVLRPDKQDFQGTAVMVDLARKLKVPKLLMVVNRVLEKSDFSALSQQISQTYEANVASLFPNCDEMMELASSDLFYLRFPEHSLSSLFRELADQVMA